MPGGVHTGSRHDRAPTPAFPWDMVQGHMHTRVCTHIYIYSHSACTCTCSCVPVHLHTCTLVMHTCACTHICTQPFMHIHTWVHAHVHTQYSTCAHSWAHTHLRIHPACTCTLVCQHLHLGMPVTHTLIMHTSAYTHPSWTCAPCTHILSCVYTRLHTASVCSRGWVPWNLPFSGTSGSQSERLCGTRRTGLSRHVVSA